MFLIFASSLFVLKECGVMPTLFCGLYYDDVKKNVWLIDPLENKFEVQVNKTKGSICLGSGWDRVGKLYGLEVGGWVVVTFHAADTLSIRVYDRFFTQVKYPTPPQVFSVDPSHVPFHHIVGSNVSNHCIFNCIIFIPLSEILFLYLLVRLFLFNFTLYMRFLQ